MQRRIQTYLPEGAFRGLHALANTHSTTVSAMARRVLCAVVSSNTARGVGQHEAPTPVSSAKGAGRQVGVRLPPAVFEQAGNIAAAYGQSRAGWIASVIHSVALGTPMLRREELAILNESNRQVWAVGVTLNQIAKAMNAQLKAGRNANADQLPLQLLRECLAAVDVQAAAVATLVQNAKATYRMDATESDGGSHGET